MVLSQISQMKLDSDSDRSVSVTEQSVDTLSIRDHTTESSTNVQATQTQAQKQINLIVNPAKIDMWKEV